MARMKIEVMQADIDNARSADPSACVIARALNRKTGLNFDVTTWMINIDHGEHIMDDLERFERFCETTVKMEDYIIRFDGGKRVKPTTFTVSVVKK